MKKEVLALGIIIAIIGLCLIVYKLEIVTDTETEWEWKWVPPDEVEYWKEHGWKETTNRNILREARRIPHNPDDVLLAKMTVWEYYIEVYPYQIVGAVVVLIGLVTAIIGFYIP